MSIYSSNNIIFEDMAARWISHLFLFYTGLELVDQYDNATKTLTSKCVNLMRVEAEGLDKSAITFTWQVGKETREDMT